MSTRLILLEKFATDCGFDSPARETTLNVDGASVMGLAFSSTQSSATALAAPAAQGYRIALRTPNDTAPGAPLWQTLPLPAGQELAAPPGAASNHAVRWVAAANDNELCAVLGWWWGLHSHLEPLTSRVARATKTLPKQTEVERTVIVRIGQDLFRAELFTLWKGCCALSGISLAPILRASHIKRWADSSDAERLDVHNGLLLAAHFDALFDRGLIGFADDGLILMGSAVREQWRLLTPLAPEAIRLSGIKAAHRPFLKYHRDNYLTLVSSA